MRIRALKPGFWKNEDLAKCTRDARLLFAGLWNLADSWGFLEDRPRRIKAELMPYDDDVSTATLADWIQALAAAGFVMRYLDEDGVPLIFIPTFRSHQVNSMTKEERSKKRERTYPPGYEEDGEDVSPTVEDEENHPPLSDESTSVPPPQGGIDGKSQKGRRGEGEKGKGKREEGRRADALPPPPAGSPLAAAGGGAGTWDLELVRLVVREQGGKIELTEAGVITDIAHEYAILFRSLTPDQVREIYRQATTPILLPSYFSREFARWKERQPKGDEAQKELDRQARRQAEAQASIDSKTERDRKALALAEHEERSKEVARSIIAIVDGDPEMILAPRMADTLRHIRDGLTAGQSISLRLLAIKQEMPNLYQRAVSGGMAAAS